MSLVDKLFGGLMGGGGQSQSVDWEQLAKIMKMSADMNRFNDVGVFGGTEWTEGADGKYTRQHIIPDALQGGVDNLMNRASNGFGERYSAPQQFSQLLDAKMANQMQRSGIGAGGAPPDPSMYGPPSAQQQPMQPAPQPAPQPDPNSKWEMFKKLAQQQGGGQGGDIRQGIGGNAGQFGNGSIYGNQHF